ncbi:related to mitochondrial ribosomal protein [Fusarium oxysporum]|uniref:Related to mitochondrial ribosomal protein n=1 Tax=Fusarium oxysporum TaxID=5507 RepID=A0A2H3TIB4_FUSOX|nr:related to mitochondrial ribosomal protein [Fusarium oxysporum]
MFSATRALRQAAVHAERTPLIKFLGPRTIPSNVDHTPKPHPASGVEKLPESWSGYGNGDTATTHKSFSSYRDHVQQHGPLQKSGFGGTPAASLGSVKPPQGVAFDVSELPTRFHRAPLNAAEIEAIESGGAALFG